MTAAALAVATASPDIDHDAWWASLEHGGLLIAPARLSELFSGDVPPLSRFQLDRLRRGVVCMLDDRAHLSDFLDTILEDICGLYGSQWTKGSRVDARWSRQAITGERVRPARLWQSYHGEILPVFTTGTGSAKDKDEHIPHLGVGRGRRAVARVIEWLRGANLKIALLTNGRELRLIHAGPDHDAFCQWDIERWFVEGTAGAQVTALRRLLGLSALTAATHGGNPPLVHAILESRKGQGELSAMLGERVRQAVEILIQSSHAVIDPLWAEGKATPADIYIAATRMVMRMVVILFAEARELLPRNNAVYHGSYGLQGLREELGRIAGGRSAPLRHRFSAWPRLLGLFRLVYHGSAHDELPITAYGGGLFEPGAPQGAGAGNGIGRALAALEHPSAGISDAALYQIIELLTRSRMKVQQGRTRTWVPTPVDFSDLSSEYIGILYEGLLDYELRRTPEDEAMLFLNIGDQPALPFSRLKDMTSKEIAALFEKLRQEAGGGRADGDAGTGTDDDAGGDDGPGDDADTGADADADVGDPDSDGDSAADPDAGTDPAAGRDQAEVFREVIWQWMEKAVKDAGIVRYPRKAADPLVLAAYDREVTAAAHRLCRRIVMPGEWFLVRWGGTRKGAGTFYTRPQLAGPTVRRTLRPLAYRAVSEPAQGQPGGWVPRLPEDILAIKVCDPAMGSGSFLVSALRYLTEALFESLHAHDRLLPRGDGTIARMADGAAADARSDLLPVPPDHESFEDLLKARLKRHIVERCLYGVDIDPVAVELGRLALWIETMDRYLPFEFLDHKLRPGNSLVGCWLDRFQDYPLMAWEREGGDKGHEPFVHHFWVKPAEQKATTATGKKAGTKTTRPAAEPAPKKRGDKWTQAIKDRRNQVIKPELASVIDLRHPLPFVFGDSGDSADRLHQEARAALEDIHALGVQESDEKARRYARAVRDNPAMRALRRALDAWCAIWFWPGDELEHAPTPRTLHQLPAATAALVDELARRHGFFHWELEFPDVFAGPASGFDAIIGNPPWDIQKPSSMEFFSNLDPLYRTYTKQQALSRQIELFGDPAHEHAWLEYSARFKALSSWVKYVAAPFGDPDEASDGKGSSLVRGSKNAALHKIWRVEREARRGYADLAHPFRHQGSADINTYKLFVELGHALLRPGGGLGLLLPSGLYTDNGSKELRRLLLEQCAWSHVYAFQNERFVFTGIDHRFKMVIVHASKGGRTAAIATRFRLGPGDSPGAAEVADDIEADSGYLPVPVVQIHRFSPTTLSLLEVRTGRDLEILETLYANGVLLGEQGPSGWGIQYATEFHMTNDSKLFPPRPAWEAKGYQADEYGHWLKGPWRPGNGCHAAGEREWSYVRSADGSQQLAVADIEDVALPLMQGGMLHQFDFSQKCWVSGTGLRAIWKPCSWAEKRLEPQFLMGLRDLDRPTGLVFKPTIRRIARNTDTRMMIAGLIPRVPCGDVASVLLPSDTTLRASLVGCLNAFACDLIVRERCGGTHVDYHYIAEVPLPKPALVRAAGIESMTLRLAAAHPIFAPLWMDATTPAHIPWRRLWAVTRHERLRVRAILDAVVAKLYGLRRDDLAWILRDCDHPLERVCDQPFSRTLDPKGFWRVDKDQPPELRHPVLALIAFDELDKLGLEAFLAMNQGEGWMLPQTLRLADHGLGHDSRAAQPQPVAAALGPRFHDWQLAQSAADSWDECARHAALIHTIVPPPEAAADGQPGTDGHEYTEPEPVQLGLFAPEPPVQLGLFAPKPRKPR